MNDRFFPIAEKTVSPAIAGARLEDLRHFSPVCRAELELCGDNFLKNLGDLLCVSPPMLDALRSHPSWLGWLRRRNDTAEVLETVHWQSAWDGWTAEAELPENPMNSLRAFKRREYLEIAYRDISGINSFEEIVGRLSDLADGIIGIALAQCWREISESEPAVPSWSAPSKGFVVFAFGKLGGRELNYSSDVDLLFCRRFSDDPVELSFFTRLGEKLVRELSRVSADGFLYRVDMRLRPYGGAGQLVPTLNSIATYYESWGESWERQALLKARFVAGDRLLGKQLSAFRERFLFERELDDPSLEEIKRVKYRSEKAHDSAVNRIDVKHGTGGIRDVEFYVQYLQLIAGTVHPDARTGTTLLAIEALERARTLLEGESTILSLAYVFLRTVEHRLQLRGLTPETVVPEKREDLDLHVGGLGIADVHEFHRILAHYRASVRTILERIYLTPGYLRVREQEEDFAQLLTERAPGDRVRQLLSPYGFHDPDKAWRNLRLMALGPSNRMLPPGERKSFLEIVVPLLEILRDSFDPDIALHNLESFAATTGNRVSFLRALASRRPHLARLANLFALSNQSHQILVRHPEYFDTLARGIHMLEARQCGEMLSELQERFGVAPKGEKRVDVIRRYRQREMVRIAYRDLANLGNPVEVSHELSMLAEACVLTATELVQTPDEPFLSEVHPTLQILALGKLGSRQMHYSSDLDLVFLYDPSREVTSARERAESQRYSDGWVEQILDLLAGVKTEGVAYRVDLRLRPEGSSGLLARSWDSFLEYARRYMQPWERMALVRSRLLTTQTGAARWDEVLAEVVYMYPWDEEGFDAIRHIKRRIENERSKESSIYLDFKFGKGGVSDLEFLVQFLQIQYGKTYPGVRTSRVDRALDALCQVEALTDKEGKELLEAHQFQRHVENHYQLMEEWVSHEISRESPVLARLARSLGYSGVESHAIRRDFLSDWEEHCRRVRCLVDKYFYGGS